jgi:polyisoprenoid-binding protein YceI
MSVIEQAAISLDRPEVGTWIIDPAHSSVTAIARHMMVTKVRGDFRDLSGTIAIGEDDASSGATATFVATSIDTGQPQRDDHLRSPDFLDAERFPTIDFASTAVTSRGGNRYQLDGDLTIRGVTRPVTIELTYEGVATDPWGQAKAIFAGHSEIDREDFGMTWNQALEAGGVLVSKKIKIELDVQASRQN